MKVPCNDLRGSKTNIMGKPIGGVFAIVDLNAREVVDVIDTGEIPIPDDSANYDRDSLGELKEPLKPVQQSSPRGNNFTVDGHVVRWQNWSFHFRMDKRAGLVISLAGYEDDGTTRPVMYQGYLSEIFVPYMDPAVDMYWRTFMDVGEYGLGLLATSLTKQSDCAANAVYFPAVLQMLGDGKPVTLDDAICLFERNDGNPSWRHAEWINETHESRPKVDLVLRMAFDDRQLRLLSRLGVHPGGRDPRRSGSDRHRPGKSGRLENDVRRDRRRGHALRHPGRAERRRALPRSLLQLSSRPGCRWSREQLRQGRGGAEGARRGSSAEEYLGHRNRKP